MDAFARRLLGWFDHHGRHDLPWQYPRTPYRVWVSEVMLQQTQVTTVTSYFDRFVAALPNLRALAAAEEGRVLALWSGLGYYRRAHHLHVAARLCMVRHGGDLPHDFDALVALPGIGRSTAGAILALAHGQRHAILDGNVKRVLSRYHGLHGWPGERAAGDALWHLAEAHTPAMRLADYTQAIMDLGAAVCTRRNPRCDACPQSLACVAYKQGLVEELPQARPTRVLPEKQVTFVVLRDRHGRVLLQHRTPQGVWPGLWSLPETTDRRAAGNLAARVADINGQAGAVRAEIRHHFTHYRLRAIPVVWEGVQAQRHVADDPGLRWCSRADMETLGIPAPVRKWLEAQADAHSCAGAIGKSAG